MLLHISKYLEEARYDFWRLRLQDDDLSCKLRCRGFLGGARVAESSISVPSSSKFQL